MSGRPTITDAPMAPARRAFIKQAGLLGVSFAILGVHGCRPPDKYAHIKGGMAGAAHATGHLLRNDNAVPAPTEYIETDILIAGGGIAGLSAARWLAGQGVKDVMMLEMADSTGGNSSWGSNKASAYPWGAHYLPVPDNADTEILSFLESLGVVTGYKDGLPVYNEYHLCHDPEERLFINGYWQEGLIPHFSVPAADRAQIAAFMKHVAALREQKGNDGKYAFCLPLDNSSTDAAYRDLDKITFEKYLENNGYSSPYLLWYLNYCCKDDYGMGVANTSAWAGLHYFASRRGRGTNADHAAVLTWPQGNGFLADGLMRQAGTNIRKGVLAHRVLLHDDHTEVRCYDANSKKSFGIRAKKLLLSSPQYANRYMLTGIDKRPIADEASYAPWVVANITFGTLPQGRGTPLCWDNVIYGQDSVGYVYANHQNVSPHGQSVITWYLPVAGKTAKEARQSIYTREWKDWVRIIMADLAQAHAGIEHAVENIDVWVWGHGMIQPTPGYIWGAARAEAVKPIANRIFFAHSDLSGISVFEEAFHQGIRAAKEIMAAS